MFVEKEDADEDKDEDEENAKKISSYFVVVI